MPRETDICKTYRMCSNQKLTPFPRTEGHYSEKMAVRQKETIKRLATQHTWINEAGPLDNLRTRFEHPSMEEGATTIVRTTLFGSAIDSL